MDGFPGVRNYGVVDPDDLYDVYCYAEELNGDWGWEVPRGRDPSPGLPLTPWICKPSRLLCQWDFLGKNTSVVFHFLLQGILLTLGLNPCLLCWQVGSLPLTHQGSPIKSLSASNSKPFH